MNLTTGTVEAAPPGGLFTGYVPPSGTFDELKAADGSLRASSRRFAADLEQSGPQGLTQHADQVRRLLRENGVTYSLHGAPQGPDRPWDLDPLPLLIDAREWQPLSEGIRQRVALLNRILADVYGPQTLLKSGLLPPKMVYGHASFLLPCHGIPAPRDVFLHLHACHLARQPDGRWIVLADRSQGPSGAGYAVENRIILSRTLPANFQSLHVERLASFFIALRETLLELASRHPDNPRVVLLSPGRRSPTYFEDAYLARYLGYTLVEGGDLTVRGGEVFLKTLGGLLPVDVILRRSSDDDCDPLELNPHSLLGPPGLVQAARMGNVAIANALGSGFLESPALMAFLPDICRFFFDEDLKLPSVPTWWCGRPDDLRHVEARLDELIVRPAFRHRAAEPILGWRLSAGERATLVETIRRQPGLFVAQSRIARSTAPVWNGRELQSWNVGLRTFAVASAGDYRIMPGGLSRLTASADFLSESVGGGEKSKDVWILADRPVPPVTLLRPPAKAVELRRSSNDLPSRVADDLLWLGRYVERAECRVRHLRSAVVRMTNDLEASSAPELFLLIEALGEATSRTRSSTPAKDVAADGAAESAPPTFERLREEIVAAVFDAQAPTSLHQIIQSLQRTASIVRDRISIDAWRLVNQLDLAVLFPWDSRRARLGDVLLLLNQLLNLLSAFSGLGMESMTRGPGWHFLDMGRRLERAQQTLRLVRRMLVDARPEIVPVLEAVLEIADSSMTYRYRYLASLQLAPVLDLLLIDETNPRAVGFQLDALTSHMRELPRQIASATCTNEEKIMLAAQGATRLTDVEALCECDESGRRELLEQFLDVIDERLAELYDSITQTYLTHTGPTRQLGGE